MDLFLVFLLAGAIIVGAIILAWIGRRSSHSINVEYYRAKCLEIEHQLKADDPSTYHMAVINGDKLVDHALKAKGFKGQTMGDRLKNAKSFISDNNGVWAAHKIRNQIVHETGFNLDYKQSRYALVNFRKALKDLGVI